MALMTDIWDPEIADDPLKFVMFVFPWGKPNTPLHNAKGPKNWQREDLEALGEHIRDNKRRMAQGLEPKVYKEATVSGRGPGKSAKFAWLTYWMMSTRLGGTVIVTANTEAQLKTRTWAELGKWHTLAINSHWFERQALSLRPAPWFDESVRKQLQIDTGYYYAAAQLWSEENPDSFAGVHNHHGVMVQFDEASGIPSPIWTVTEGFFTEPTLNRYWMAASNGRRNTGDFFECFHRNRDAWRRRQLDARTVEGAALEVLNGIITKYGEDSDEARVEVLGQFPQQSQSQFISRALVEAALKRQVPEPPDTFAPLILGVDTARFGEASSVLFWRQGRDARSIPPQRYRGLNTVQLVDAISMWIDKTNPDAVNIDAGNGAGVVDLLRHRGYRVNEVWFGGKPNDPRWYNKRTEMWANLREWLEGGCIPAIQELHDDLVNPEYDYPGGGGKTSGDRISLESKDSLQRRGFASPDFGDALALTFAVRVNRRDSATSARRNRGAVAAGTGFDVFSQSR